MSFQDSSWNISTSSLVILAVWCIGEKDRETEAETVPPWLPSSTAANHIHCLSVCLFHTPFQRSFSRRTQLASCRFILTPNICQIIYVTISGVSWEIACTSLKPHRQIIEWITDVTDSTTHILVTRAVSTSILSSVSASSTWVNFTAIDTVIRHRWLLSVMTQHGY